MVEDESGREWAVYEREPDVDTTKQLIVCQYDFEATMDSTKFSQSVEHHYLLPEQLVRLLDASGFTIDSIEGDFEGQTFEPLESQHLVVVATRNREDSS